MPKNILKLILSIGICLGAGVLGSFFTVSSISTWYGFLNKPIFSPPNWIFGSVWTVLYVLMGVALYLALSGKGKGEREKAIRIFAIQLILNAAWSIIFFGMRNPALALEEIIALWIAIILTIKAFLKINKLAGKLLVPYLVWVSFAAILNLFIVLLNRGY